MTWGSCPLRPTADALTAVWESHSFRKLGVTIELQECVAETFTGAGSSKRKCAARWSQIKSDGSSKSDRKAACTQRTDVDLPERGF